VKRWIAALALLLLASPASGREALKHPRVAELEEFLRQTAEAHLRSRFPSQPFQVLVSIDPLFRYESEGDDEGDTLAGEDLPAMFVSREEIRDEWDDPSRSLHQLMSRVRKVKVELALPAGLSDDDVEETKSGIQSTLHLIPGRDTIDVVRKPWQGTGQTQWLAILGALCALGLLLGGNYLITQKSAERLSTALKSINLTTQTTGGPIMHAGGATAAASGAGGGDKKLGGEHDAQDVNMLDPLKIRDIVIEMVGRLEKDPGFPTLQDVIILDDLGRTRCERMVAAVEEMSPAMRTRLFSIGNSSSWWMEAFHGAKAQVDYETLHALQKMNKVKRLPEELDWNRLLVQVWRMEDKLPAFLKEIGEKRSMAILSAFPKSISVPVAKKTFPGSWAVLLSPNFVTDRLPESEIGELIQRSLKHAPERDEAVLGGYRQEQELLAYLGQTGPEEEREIYEALPENSKIFSLRPPFYRLFSQTREVVAKITQELEIADCAAILHGLPTQMRMKVIETLSEKRGFMVAEQLKRFEKQPPDSSSVTLKREWIGRQIEKVKAEIAAGGESASVVAAVPASEDTSSGEELADFDSTEEDKRDAA
jgi:hypothetical protein